MNSSSAPLAAAPRRARPQFWKVKGLYADGDRVDAVVYATTNIQAEAAACALIGRHPDELLWCSVMHISSPDFEPKPMPAVEFPTAAPSPTADQLDAATSGMAFDDYEVARQAREDHNTRTVLRAGDWLRAAAAVALLAAAVLLASEGDMPYSPSVASTVSEVLP